MSLISICLHIVPLKLIGKTVNKIPPFGVVCIALIVLHAEGKTPNERGDICIKLNRILAQFEWAGEYTDCISEKG